MKCVIVRVCMCIDFRQRPFEFFSELFVLDRFLLSVLESTVSRCKAEFSKVYPCCVQKKRGINNESAQ